VALLLALAVQAHKAISTNSIGLLADFSAPASMAISCPLLACPTK